MKNIKTLIWFVFIFALVGGCTLPFGKAREKGKLVQTYLQKAQEYEQEEDLVEALKQYKMALTVNPDHPLAAAKSREIQAELKSSAEKHYQEGLKYQRQGKYQQARHEFLTALRLWPDHLEAAKMLIPRKKIKVSQVKRFVVHTIKAGESLSKLAMMYYGDYHKFPIIAEYNNLPDATKVVVGQKIKVPEIKGVPFLVKKQDIKAEPVTPPKEIRPEEPTRKEPAEPEKPVDTVANYRELGIELFNNNNYQEAIIELNKVLNADPDDKAALEYLSRSHFQLGMNLYNK